MNENNWKTFHCQCEVISFQTIKLLASADLSENRFEAAAVETRLVTRVADLGMHCVFCVTKSPP
jgi:hypothetical protein